MRSVYGGEKNEITRLKTKDEGQKTKDKPPTPKGEFSLSSLLQEGLREAYLQEGLEGGFEQ